MADSDEVESNFPKQASSLHTGQKAVIFDVREDSELNKQHIPGAIHIPLTQLK